MKRWRWSLVAIAIGVQTTDVHAQSMDMPMSHMKWSPTVFVMAERLEAAAVRPSDLSFDLMGWYGGSSRRLWIRAEGNVDASSGSGDGQLEALYGKLISPFFDALIGVRVDHRWGEESASRALLAVGIEGIAPNWFHVEATAFLSQNADVSAQVTTTYDLLLSQRVVFEPRLEFNAALSEAPEFGLGAGLTNVELGGRLRYEITRKFAPYVGVNWEQRFGRTADYARQDGEAVRQARVVAGLRAWY